MKFDIAALNSWTVPHPPAEPSTAISPRTPRHSRTHAYVNAAPSESHATAGLSQAYSYATVAVSQSPATDINSMSAVGQTRRTDMHTGGKQGNARDRDLTTDTAQSSAEYDEHYSRSNSSMTSSVNVSGSRNVSVNHRSSATSGPPNNGPVMQQNNSTRHKQLVRSASGQRAGHEVLTTPQQTGRRTPDSSHSSPPTRHKENVMFGKTPSFSSSRLLSG